MTEHNLRKQPVTVTRQELYQQVWKTPMIRLAETYGITGNGLAKICQRLNVPFPPRGYWAKKAAGKKVITYRLPDAVASTPGSVVISPTPAPAKPPKPAPEVQQQIEVARTKTGTIVVPDRLLRPHTIIAGWLAEHERRKKEARHEWDPILRRLRKPSEFTDFERRQHRILNALFKELESQGAVIKEGNRFEFYAEVLGERLEFQLREKQRQIRRRLTDEERQGVRYNRNQEWTQERQQTGKLLLAIKTYLPAGVRVEWLETDAIPMEALLPDIITVFIAAGPMLVERRKQREEEARLQRLAEQKRYEEQQRRKQDKNRWKHFIRYAEKQKEADLAQAFLNALKSTGANLEIKIEEKTIAEWIEWAEGKIADANVISKGAEAIFSDVASVQAFTYTD